MKTEQPTEAPSSGEGVTLNHPAFGQISACRRSGRAILYGSDFIHNDVVAITIFASQLNRNHSKDWPFAEKELIEVELSEAQWATFVSSLNIHGGVQCTIRHKDCVSLPGLPVPTDRHEQCIGEAREKINSSLIELKNLQIKIGELKISQKQKDELLSSVRKSRMEIEQNAPFVIQSFGEHMETVTEKAKIEVNAYATGAIMRAGLAAMKSPLLELGEGRAASAEVK